MEELVHWIMIYISNPEGQLIKIQLEFARGMTLLECMDFASDHRESVATYYDEVNRWIMNDGSGDWVGSQCYQDPERLK